MLWFVCRRRRWTAAAAAAAAPQNVRAHTHDKERNGSTGRRATAAANNRGQSRGVACALASKPTTRRPTVTRVCVRVAAAAHTHTHTDAQPRRRRASDVFAFACFGLACAAALAAATAVIFFLQSAGRTHRDRTTRPPAGQQKKCTPHTHTHTLAIVGGRRRRRHRGCVAAFCVRASAALGGGGGARPRNSLDSGSLPTLAPMHARTHSHTRSRSLASRRRRRRLVSSPHFYSDAQKRASLRSPQLAVHSLFVCALVSVFVRSQTRTSARTHTHTRTNTHSVRVAGWARSRNQ